MNERKEAGGMAEEEARVFPYGVRADQADYECVDCGALHRQGEAQRLPPCAYYQETTHGRAGWRRLDPDQKREAPETMVAASAADPEG
jgi:hypothetical protein